MGVDKARIPFPGSEPMAVAVARRLLSVCGRVALVRRGEPDGLPWPIDGGELDVIRDRQAGPPHPLHGVSAALHAAGTEWVLVVPCDVPELSTDALRSLIVGEPAVATDASQRLHPLVGVYPKSWAGRAESLARSGSSARAFAEGARQIELPEGALKNLNRWADAGRPGPVRALLHRLGAVEDGAERIAEGELVRLAGVGVMDPEQSIRYARLHRGASR
jgi:molybdopterin-guanine dinucleotide biosynthesis protein A